MASAGSQRLIGVNMGSNVPQKRKKEFVNDEQSVVCQNYNKYHSHNKPYSGRITSDSCHNRTLLKLSLCPFAGVASLGTLDCQSSKPCKEVLTDEKILHFLKEEYKMKEEALKSCCCCLQWGLFSIIEVT
ncbi:uncharacterized protein [Montipora foliosa]|uniref:uncharacterized protein isoform X2 n=1 Tax=Montipora foliosa TaxID=591990 RepID=UPI0035F17294